MLSTQELRNSINNMDLLTFNNTLLKHHDVFVKLAKSDVRFRNTLKMKLNSLKQNCHLKAIYLEMEI
jgi:hypothetical protein